MSKPRIVRAIGIASVAWVISGALSAQVPSQPAFEVASIKPTNGPFAPSPLFAQMLATVRGLSFQPGGRFVGKQVSLRMLLAFANDIPVIRATQAISGGPKWLDTDFFDIEAKAAADSPANRPRPAPETMYLMLRTLLADRFKLTVHTEKKESPIFALVVAKRDGSLGPQLQPTAAACAAWIAAGRQNAPPPLPGDLPCGRMTMSTSGVAASAMTMAQLATALSPRVERLVEDRTGLAGNFAVDLKWTQERATQGGADAALPDFPTSIFTALRDQLGLKLDSQKETVEVLVVDHAEPPIED